MNFDIDRVVIDGCINIGESEYIAYYEDENIGSILFIVSSDYEGNPAVAYPCVMHVKEAYRHRGVATKIIKEVKKEIEVIFQADLGHSGNSDEIHYTDEGRAFKEYCEKNGITRGQ